MWGKSTRKAAWWSRRSDSSRYSLEQVMGVWWRWWNRSVPSAFVWSVSETLWSWAAGTYPGPQQEIWKQRSYQKCSVVWVSFLRMWWKKILSLFVSELWCIEMQRSVKNGRDSSKRTTGLKVILSCNQIHKLALIQIIILVDTQSELMRLSFESTTLQIKV